MNWLRNRDEPGVLILSGTPFAVRYDAKAPQLPWLLTKDGVLMAGYATLSQAKANGEVQARELVEVGLIELEDPTP